MHPVTRSWISMRSGTSSTMHWTHRVRLSAFPAQLLCSSRVARSARAGITLYRVLWVQSQPDGRAIVMVDGGLSDNPQVALRDARHPIALANRHSMTPTQPMTVVGRHRESDDAIARDIPLPTDLHAGDLLAMACTGAYHHSMASTYN